MLMAHITIWAQKAVTTRTSKTSKNVFQSKKFSCLETKWVQNYRLNGMRFLLKCRKVSAKLNIFKESRNWKTIVIYLAKYVHKYKAFKVFFIHNFLTLLICVSIDICIHIDKFPFKCQTLKDISINSW